MTEETPFNPCSKTGKVRAKIPTPHINEWKSGALTAIIARAADFYGSETPNGMPKVLVFKPFAKIIKRRGLQMIRCRTPPTIRRMRREASLR